MFLCWPRCCPFWDQLRLVHLERHQHDTMQQESAQEASSAIGLSDGWRPQHNALDLLASFESLVGSSHITDLQRERAVMIDPWRSLMSNNEYSHFQLRMKSRVSIAKDMTVEQYPWNV